MDFSLFMTSGTLARQSRSTRRRDRMRWVRVLLEAVSVAVAAVTTTTTRATITSKVRTRPSRTDRPLGIPLARHTKRKRRYWCRRRLTATRRATNAEESSQNTEETTELDLFVGSKKIAAICNEDGCNRTGKLSSKTWAQAALSGLYSNK